MTGKQWVLALSALPVLAGVLVAQQRGANPKPGGVERGSDPLRLALQTAEQAPTAGCRAVAMASLAWTCARLDRAEIAREALGAAVVALEGIDSGGREGHAQRVHSRLAAASFKLGEVESAKLHFEQGLAGFAALRPYTAKKTLAAWLEAFADARPLDQPWSGALIDVAFQRWAALKVDQQGYLLAAAAESFNRLGLAERAGQKGLDLLESGALPLMPLEDLVEGLAALRGVTLGARARLGVWAGLKKAEPGEIDEFAPPMIAAVLGGDEEPLELTGALAQEFAAEGHSYAALLCRYAALLHLSQTTRARQHGDELERLLEATWAHRGSRVGGARPRAGASAAEIERMRILYRLIPLIPKFFAPTRALELIQRERRRALEREQVHYVLNELLGYAAQAAGELVGDADALRFVEETAATAIEIYEAKLERARSGEALGSTPALLFETLAACAEAAGEIKAARSSALVDRIGGYATAAVDAVPLEGRAEARQGGSVWFPCQALLACARARAALGDGDGARGLLERVLAAAATLSEFDCLDGLENVLKSCAGLEESEEVVAAAVGVFRSTADTMQAQQLWEDFYDQLAVTLTQGARTGDR